MVLLLPACESDNAHNPFEGKTGKLVIKVTDEPFPVDMIDSAIVTVVKAEIRTLTDTAYPYIVVLEDTSLSFNLIELRNGVMAEMVEVDIPSGDYDLIRLYITEASLTVKDGETYRMKVPSGSQTGIKVYIDPAVRISGGLITELLLDFSLEQSFVLKGNYKTADGIKGFNFRPVIRAVNNTNAGMVTGVVTDEASLPIENAEVWIEQDTLLASSFTDPQGYYAIPGIPAGHYNICATAENYDTACVTGINVTAGNPFNQNFVLTMQ